MFDMTLVAGFLLLIFILKLNEYLAYVLNGGLYSVYYFPFSRADIFYNQENRGQGERKL